MGSAQSTLPPVLVTDVSGEGKVKSQESTGELLANAHIMPWVMPGAGSGNHTQHTSPYGLLARQQGTRQ